MIDTQPMVSVCIANYNGMEVIDDCIRSVLSQQGEIQVEILVHDDASTDGSLNYIRENYPQVKLISSTDNVGFCIANNRMATAATGQYLLLLNNDAALFPDALQALLAEAQRLAKPAILSLPQFDATSGKLVDRGCLLDPFFNPVPNLDPKRNDVAMVIGACLWIPKDLWDEMEGFPAWFGSIAEDMYLCCRARLAGYAVWVLPISGYRHWQGKSFGGNRVVNNRLTSTFKRRALSEKNKTFVMVMTCPRAFIFILLPIHLLLLLAEALLISLFKFQINYLIEIYLPVFKKLKEQLPKLLRLRNVVMASRSLGTTKFFLVFDWLPYKLRMLVRHGIPALQ